MSQVERYEQRLTKTKQKGNPEYTRQAEATLLEARAYEYAKNHPELCPPIGTVTYLINEYGVKIKRTVRMIMCGLPGVESELLPMDEQPPHLQSPELLAVHCKGIKFGFTQWADGYYVEYIKGVIK